MAKEKQLFPGWQTIDRAARRGDVTRQRVHQVLTEHPDIKTLEVLSRRLVPDPFPYKFRPKSK